jgi:AraC-like DNA-binding protein
VLSDLHGLILPADDLARRVSCSPHYLSRVFSEGERSLAGLAHELGFADHAHLTRTIRAV